MAARVTKLFLQNYASASNKSANESTNKHKKLQEESTMSKKPRKKLRQKNKKMSSKYKVKVLEEARRELKQADRTAQNLCKLKSKMPMKSQRLMAKVLEQRTVAFR